MSTQFFERQEIQKAQTRWLVWAFMAAILLVVLVINLVILIGLGASPGEVLRREPMVVVWISGLVLVTILGASVYKSLQLRSGGAAVAQALGGVQVTASDTDLQRKRLLNIVEEMAIAARIRKPQVFVLPEEAGINAFAAGHRPDEAAVAVTQGALDKLDRDQLQAVIGHEFSHILNGDMKINMRLTAWIFGLFVITAIARRIMRGRSRGKGAARIKLIAFGIFIAGSVGMLAGRLLQAAVSRRREHLADASAVQFTRNPQALQGAFIVMAASAEGSRLEHEASSGVSHMFFAGSEPAWAARFGGSWFATHPPLEQRVQALDSRVTPSRFKMLISEERRRQSAKARIAGESGASHAADSAATASAAAPRSAGPVPGVAAGALVSAMVSPAVPASASQRTAPPSPGPAARAVDLDTGGLSLAATGARPALAETLPSGVRLLGGKPLPPDILRHRLTQEQQAAIQTQLTQVDGNLTAVQATYIAAMLAGDAAQCRMQLTKLAPVLGIELLKETQQQVPRLRALALAARLPLLIDLLAVLDTLPAADRKRLRAVARAFAPTVALGDMLRFAVTRLLEKRLAPPAAAVTPVPLPQRAQAVCELYASLAHCRFGAGKQGLNAYRAGLMGLLPAQAWLTFPEAPLRPASLDTALAGVAEIHPTGRRAFSEGMARVIAVGGLLTVPQVDLLRGICVWVDCAVPTIPVDVVYEESNAAPRAQVRAR